MACTLVGISASNCTPSFGGITVSYITALSSITAVTFDSNEQVTAVTMSGTGLWKKFEFDTEREEAYYNQNTSTDNGRNSVAQEANMVFLGYDNDKRKSIQSLIGCCEGLVAIHFMGNGKAQIQGIQKDGSTFTVTNKKGKLTANALTDTSANSDRAEFKLTSTHKDLSHFTTLTKSAIEAL